MENTEALKIRQEMSKRIAEGRVVEVLQRMKEMELDILEALFNASLNDAVNGTTGCAVPQDKNLQGKATAEFDFLVRFALGHRILA